MSTGLPQQTLTKEFHEIKLYPVIYVRTRCTCSTISGYFALASKRTISKCCLRSLATVQSTTLITH